MGRLREALAWYATVAEISIDGLVYLAPAAARQAEILERLGEKKAAATQYQRVLELWSDADAECSAWLTRARSRLQALGYAPMHPKSYR